MTNRLLLAIALGSSLLSAPLAFATTATADDQVRPHETDVDEETVD